MIDAIWRKLFPAMSIQIYFVMMTPVCFCIKIINTGRLAEIQERILFFEESAELLTRFYSVRVLCNFLFL